MTTNTHGLDRYITEDISRQVRQECGFGCVICGLAIIQYHHFDPEFTDAKIHDPGKIALLCGSCHDRARGFWSTDRVINARKHPITFKQGCSKDIFDFRDPFELFVGDSHFQNVRCIVRKSSGEEWFTIEPAESPEAPPRVSAKVYAADGSIELEILQNEWRCRTSVWDLTTEGSVIQLWRAPGEIALRLKARPPQGLEIQRLKMLFKGTGIEVKNDGTTVLVDSGIEIEMNTTAMPHGDAVFIVP